LDETHRIDAITSIVKAIAWAIPLIDGTVLFIVLDLQFVAPSLFFAGS